MLDVDELYKILTTEKSLLLAHPQLANEEVDERMANGFEDKSDAARRSGGDRYQQAMRRARGEKEAEVRKSKEEEGQQGKPAIDLTAELKRFDEPRLKLLLDFFA